MMNNAATTEIKMIDLFEVTFIDSFCCQPTEVVYGDTVSAIIRDRTIAWMESVGFNGVSYRKIEDGAGYLYRGDLDAEYRAGRHPWRRAA